MNGINSLILASSSAHRRRQLAQLGLPFECVSPHLDESPLADETPEATARRLAEAKASHVLQNHPGGLIIGSDQVAQLHNQRLTKPHTLANARKQLMACSANRVTFYTAVCVKSSERSFTEVIPTTVTFLSLSSAIIDDYLARESPLDCAGSFKCEGLGIALFQSIESTDPSALIGLPLISVNRMLAQHGFNILGQDSLL